MPLFTVHFAGLICHIAKDISQPLLKTHSALVFDADHTPYVHVTGAPPLILPPGSRIRFSTDIDGATGDSAFATSYHVIPHLASLLYQGRTITPAVLAGSVGAPGVAAFVDLPAGALSVAEYFPTKGAFTLSTTTFPETCIGRVIALTIETSELEMEVALPGGRTHTFPLSSSIPTAIGNASEGGLHFNRHRFLTDAQDNEIATVAEKNACLLLPHGPKPVRIITQVECTNSQWP